MELHVQVCEHCDITAARFRHGHGGHLRHVAANQGLVCAARTCILVSLHLSILLLVCPSVFLAFNISVLLSFYVGLLFIFLSFCSGQPEGHQRPP
jgi:hypothetical protein